MTGIYGLKCCTWGILQRGICLDYAKWCSYLNQIALELYNSAINYFLDIISDHVSFCKQGICKLYPKWCKYCIMRKALYNHRQQHEDGIRCHVQKSDTSIFIQLDIWILMTNIDEYTSWSIQNSYSYNNNSTEGMHIRWNGRIYKLMRPLPPNWNWIKTWATSNSKWYICKLQLETAFRIFAFNPVNQWSKLAKSCF